LFSPQRVTYSAGAGGIIHKLHQPMLVNGDRAAMAVRRCRVVQASQVVPPAYQQLGIQRHLVRVLKSFTGLAIGPDQISNTWYNRRILFRVALYSRRVPPVSEAANRARPPWRKQRRVTWPFCSAVAHLIPAKAAPFSPGMGHQAVLSIFSITLN